MVTGASSGIGWELTKLLAQDGYDLVLVARNRKKLEELGRDLTAAHGIRAQVLASDLTDPSQPRRIFEETRDLGLAVEVLVNDAGFGVYGPFAKTDLSEELRLLQVNLAAVVELTKRFLAPMLERGRGRILNVASTAAFQPGPLMAVYYASKAFVLSFSEAIADELAQSGVTVTALCPGPTQTEFQKKAGLEQTRLFRGPLVMNSRAVARAGYEGMKRGRRVVVPGLGNKLLMEAIRVTPRRLVTAIARRIQESR